VGEICVVYQADIDPNQNDLYLLNIIANAISVEEERKRAQEALQKAEKKYRSIFENAIEGIFQSTPGGIYIGANTAMAKMFGYESPEDLMADISDIKKQVYVDPHQMVEFMRLGKGWVCQGFRISSLP